MLVSADRVLRYLGVKQRLMHNFCVGWVHQPVDPELLGLIPQKEEFS